MVSHFTTLFTREEIKSIVSSMNKEVAPGPYGFEVFFFQACLEIIKEDVYMMCLNIFLSNWILPNMNANSVVLMPKIPNEDTISQFKPVAMDDFKFKILLKKSWR